jgi:hypothetical protein
VCVCECVSECVCACVRAGGTCMCVRACVQLNGNLDYILAGGLVMNGFVIGHAHKSILTYVYV